MYIEYMKHGCQKQVHKVPEREDEYENSSFQPLFTKL